MIQRQLKLRLNTAQEAQLDLWLFHLTGVWNWAIRKLEQDAEGDIYYTRKAFHNLLAVRQWVCAVCGTAHDCDVNAAMNTLTAGVGTTHESHRKVAPGIPAL